MPRINRNNQAELKVRLSTIEYLLRYKRLRELQKLPISETSQSKAIA